jgi:hypothetical protein
MNRLSLESFQVTIATGGTTSGAANIGGKRLVGIELPSNFIGTTFSLQTSTDGVTFQTMQMAGADKSYTSAASKNVNLASDMIYANYIKMVAGSSQTTNDKIITLVVAPV